MLKKRMMILGLAGVLATGFGVAGCSGSSNVVDGTETAEVVNVTETVGQIEESSVAEVVTDFVETETVAQQNEGKYTYEILDGKVTVPLNTKVEDYIVPWRTLNIGIDEDGPCLDVLRLATDLGWTPSKLRQNVDFAEKRPMEYTYYNSYGEEIFIYGMGNLTSDGRWTADDSSPSCGFAYFMRGADVSTDGGAPTLLFCSGHNGLEYIDQCTYGTTFDGAVSYDYIVLFTYLLENAGKSNYAGRERPFKELFEDNGVLDEVIFMDSSYGIFQLF